ncbi:MAG: hypothetical protein ABL970_11350 [Nitrospira sp.]
MIQTQTHITAVMDIPHPDPSITAGCFTLSYSGMDGSRMVMGDGLILGLSEGAMLIAGDARVQPGMELALMVALPESDDHLCFAGAHVSWTEGSSFGIDLAAVPEATRTQLNNVIDLFME